MNKTKTVLLAFLFSVFLLTGWIGSAVADETLTGKYSITALLGENGKEVMNFRKTSETLGADLVLDNDYVEFLSDGKCKMVVVSYDGTTEINEGIFTQNGKFVEITSDGDAEPLKGEIDGNKIFLMHGNIAGILVEKQ